MLLEQLLLGILVVGVVVLFLPLLLVMASVGAAMLLWFVVSAAAAMNGLLFQSLRIRFSSCVPACWDAERRSVTDTAGRRRHDSDQSGKALSVAVAS